jgi:hypothetical protein
MWGFFCLITTKQQRANSRQLVLQRRILIYQGFCVTGKNSNDWKIPGATLELSQVELVLQRITFAELNFGYVNR